MDSTVVTAALAVMVVSEVSAVSACRLAVAVEA
jgi:hypothetical protein